MSKKMRKTRQKIVKSLVSLLVLATFAIPTYLTAGWVVGAVNTRDPRKVVTVQSLKVRAIDNPLTEPKPFDEPLISVTFDDGWLSVYTEALPVMQNDGIATTQYLITDIFDNYHYMSVAQARSMQQAGHNIGGHTASHADLTTLDETQLTHELKDSQKILKDKFNSPINDFTSPYGSYNVHTLDSIGKYYRSQKNAEGDPAANELEAINIKSSFKALNIKSYSVRKTTTMDDLRKLIKAAQNNNGWLVLTYHQVDNSGETFSVTPAQFKEQMQLLNESDVRIPTLGHVMDVLEAQKKVSN